MSDSAQADDHTTWHGRRSQFRRAFRHSTRKRARSVPMSRPADAMWPGASVKAGRPRLLSFVETKADDDEIALDAVELGDARQLSPAAESEGFEQREARIVVTEDEAEQRFQAEGGRPVDRAADECPSDSAALVIGC